MMTEGMRPEPTREDPEWLLRLLDAGADSPEARAQLAGWLAEHLPGAALRGVLEELTAHEKLRRAEHCDAALARARAAAELAQLDVAQREAEEACRIDPVSWQPHRLLGEILERRGDPRAALRRYMTAMSLGWESEEASLAIRRTAAAG